MTQSTDHRIEELRKRIIRDSVGNPGELQDTQLVEDAIALANTLAAELSACRSELEQARRELGHANDRLANECTMHGLLADRICEAGGGAQTVDDAFRWISAERARREGLERACAMADEIIDEYECQWGDDYLAQKWGMKEQRAEFRKLAGLDSAHSSTAEVFASSATGEGANRNAGREFERKRRR